MGILPHAVIPDELIHAAGALPLHFCLGGPGDQVGGAIYLPETTCSYQRVNLGVFERNEGLAFQIYDLIDVVVSGTFCTGVQNSANYLEHYFGKPQYRLVVPFWPTENTFTYFVGELYQFKKFLEKFCDIPVNPSAIIDSIRLYNQLRESYKEIDQYRKVQNPIVSINEIQALIHHLFLQGPRENARQVRKFLQEIKTSSRVRMTGIPIFLTGNGIMHQDNFLELLENIGFRIAGDDLSTGSEFFSSMVELDEHQDNEAHIFKALAERYFLRSLSGRMIPDTYRVQNILRTCEKYNLRAIINHCMKYCDAYAPTADLFKKDMQEQGIPVLNLDRDYSENTRGQLITRLEAFAEILQE